ACARRRPDPDRSAGRRGDTHAQPVDRHRRRRRHHRGRDRHRSLRGEETGPRRGRRNRPVTRLRGLIAPTCFLETTTERRGHCACTGVSALHRGFGRFPGARSGLGALPWFRPVPWRTQWPRRAAVVSAGFLPAYPWLSWLPWLLAHLTAAPASRAPHCPRFVVTPPRKIRAISDLASAP